MKNHAKVGNRPGRPAYRTAARFRYKKQEAVRRIKAATGDERNKITHWRAE